MSTHRVIPHEHKASVGIYRPDAEARFGASRVDPDTRSLSSLLRDDRVELWYL